MKNTNQDSSLTTVEVIHDFILFLRGQKVILSTDLADLYEVEPRIIIQAVKRNKDRFPDDFIFQLTQEEFERIRSRSQTVTLKSQFVISNRRGGIRTFPYAFTEQGVAMLSSILRSKQAVQVNIEIMRTFVKLRRLLQTNDKLAKKLAELEKKYDEYFKVIFTAINELMKPPKELPKQKIGFNIE